MYVLQFHSNLFSFALAQLRLTLRCRCVYASTPICAFISSHANIRRSTSPPPHAHTSIYISHLYIHIVIPSHPPSLSFFLSFFLSFYISFLSPLDIYIFAHSHLQIYLSTSTHLHSYIAPTYPHCHSFTSTLSFSLSTYLFPSYFKSDLLATSHSITDCIKKSWPLDNSILVIS